jgi:hypothetical protein
MTDDKDNQEEIGLGENLKAVGQIIVGEIETIGGILTADPTTQAEGEFNVEAGTLRQEANKNLTAIETDEDTPQNENR